MRLSTNWANLWISSGFYVRLSSKITILWTKKTVPKIEDRGVGAEGVEPPTLCL